MEMMDGEDLRECMFKEIDLIQSVINRMAFNSFLIKGWAVTLITVVLLLKNGLSHVSMAFLPLIMFWYLDAWFLRQERAYRKLYDWTVQNRLVTKDFLFDMKAGLRFQNNIDSVPHTMVSETLLVFYGTILLLILTTYTLNI